jgi:hypothetical protein
VPTPQILFADPQPLLVLQVFPFVAVKISSNAVFSDARSATAAVLCMSAQTDAIAVEINVFLIFPFDVVIGYEPQII